MNVVRISPTPSMRDNSCCNIAAEMPTLENKYIGPIGRIYAAAVWPYFGASAFCVIVNVHHVICAVHWSTLCCATTHYVVLHANRSHLHTKRTRTEKPPN